MIENNWLGGLDSNQDSQSQSLESYQLDDLPAVANKVVSVLDGLVSVRFSLNFHHHNQTLTCAFRNCLHHVSVSRMCYRSTRSGFCAQRISLPHFPARQLHYCRPP
jgi:hypothetical protein